MSGSDRYRWWRSHARKKSYATWALAYWHLIGVTRHARLINYRGYPWGGHVYACHEPDNYRPGTTGLTHYHVGQRPRD